MSEVETETESENASEEESANEDDSVDCDEEGSDEVGKEMSKENNIEEEKGPLRRGGSCVSIDDLDSMLQKIKNIKMRFLSDCDVMRSSLGNIEAQYCEQLQDGIAIVKQTGV